MEEASSLPELNAVLVGSKGSWKHLVGNIILGRDTFATDISSESEKGEGTVCGRRVTLVKAPGWWKGYPLCDTPAQFKTEMTLCTSLCPPGPHAFILVVNTNLVYKESYKRATVEHLQTLHGENVWDHTIIVFCSGLAHPAIDDYIQSEGVPLQSLMRQCGNRYHVLCNEDMNNKAKVKELFDKIDAMVSGNGSCRYESDGKLMQSAKDKRREVVQKAADMRLTSQTQKRKLRGLITGGERPELRILLLGWVFAGKSEAGNTILNAEEFQAGCRTLKSAVRSVEVAGRKVTVVDTPGWWKFFPALFTSPSVKSEVIRAVSLCSPSPNVILLMFCLTTSFTEEQLEITLDNMKLLGERVWRHVIVVLTWGECLGDKTVEHHIASEGKPLMELIERCGNRYHCLYSKNKADRTQVTELLEMMEEMLAGNHFFYLSAEPEREEEPRTETGGKGVGDSRNDEAAKEVVQELDNEWDRQNWEMRHIVKGNRSMTIPPFMAVGEPPSDVSEETEEQTVHGHNQAKSLEKTWRRFSLQGETEDVQRPDLTAYSMLLDREWNRRETCMELNLGRNIWTIDFQSEPDAKETLRSCEKVQSWLKDHHRQHGPNYKYGSGSGYASASASFCSSEHEEKFAGPSLPYVSVMASLLHEDDHSNMDITSFTPTVHKVQTTNEYRFKFPRTGLFHCTVTGLVFATTREGEVLYRTVQWDERWLQSKGAPAGPLFDIQCPQESVCQLHLLHCEVTLDDDLSVAHITDEGVNFLKPLKVTKTHVVVNVPHLSLFGLWISNLLKPKPTNGQVLLFLRAPSNRLEMKVFLLPSNVLIEEVMAKTNNKEDKYIDTSADCFLTPKEVYSLHCPPHDAQPKASLPYRRHYGPNYHPTFEVFMDLSSEVVSLEVQGPEEKQVWTHSNLRVKGPPPQDHLNQRSVPDKQAFFKNNRTALVSKTKNVESIVDDLISGGFHAELAARVSAENTDPTRMRRILDSVTSRELAEVLFNALLKHQHDVMMELLG